MHNHSRATPPKVDPSTSTLIVSAFQSSKQRILFLDYDGTLTPIVVDPSQAFLADEMKKILFQISTQARLVIISGRDKQFLRQTFTDIPVDIVAEHGAFTKMAQEKGWQLTSQYGQSWQQALMPVLANYVSKCAGSYIEKKETSIAWHYRTAEAEQEAQKLAKRLMDQLNESKIIKDMHLQTIDGNKVVEIKRATYNKGTATERFLREHPYDFILSIGDDTTDEDMFSVLPDFAFTIRVGESVSVARGRLESQGEVAGLLSALIAGERLT